MHFVQGRLFEGDHVYFKMSNFVNNTLSGDSKVPRNGNGKGVWQGDSTIAQTKLNPLRLRDQMFAYTVTNQVINTFVEIGLPFVLRFVSSSKIHSGKGGKKRVVFEDEVTNGAAEKSKEEREFLEIVRKEVALPEYDLFGDYSEMVTQFGYVALWSTIWPLAPGKFTFLDRFLI
jgi:anoctamin-10